MAPWNGPNKDYQREKATDRGTTTPSTVYTVDCQHWRRVGPATFWPVDVEFRDARPHSQLSESARGRGTCERSAYRTDKNCGRTGRRLRYS